MGGSADERTHDERRGTPCTRDRRRPACLPQPRAGGAGRKAVGRNTIETLLFRGPSTPIALLLVIVQSRFLEPAGRGRFVLVVLSVTILSRLLGPLGLAVTTRMRTQGTPLRRLVHRALGLAVVLGSASAVLSS